VWDIIESVYRQDEYSLAYLLLVANALSLAVFLSTDAGVKSVPVDSGRSPENPGKTAGQPSIKTAKAVEKQGMVPPGPANRGEQPLHEKVIDFQKVRSKPLVWRFPEK